MIRALLMLAVVVSLMASARSFAPAGQAQPPGAGTVLGFGFLVLAALQAGALFARLGLPRLTGYLLCGVATGPYVAGLLTQGNIADLRIVNGVAVSLIALTAGSELDLRTLRPQLRAVSFVSAIALLLTIAATTVVVALLGSRLDFLRDLTAPQRWSVALTLGVLLASLSPAVTIAIFSETRAKGPVSDTSLGVVVLADIGVIVAFTAVNALDARVFGARATTALSPLATLALEVGGSAVIGAAVALAIYAWHRVVRAHLALFILAVSITATELGARLHLDPLLVCLTAGLLLQNALGVPTAVITRTLAPSALPIFAVFFALAGANLSLGDLRVLWPAALLLSAVRAGTLIGGGRLGARLSGAPPVVQRWMPYALISQAGVSVGLAELMGRHFPSWGGGVRALVLAVMTVNVIVGPLVLRLALAKADEVGRRGDDEPSH